ncbi:Hypothetical protein R9X50_00475200 [Acrodontium crateriforme]|uniref:Uncharacterized protein n=1 Tax=Acrodontium crateriforme TaxID=150365 RepID=A0AAQ3M863_9PEZI|nr:Hypothetical protein R9X50_00475200 [Acrodontium crateriforme]
MSRVTRQTQTPEPGAERTLRSTTNGSNNQSATTSAKNPKRRQRTTEGDSQKIAPRRKRSKISADTFAPRGSPAPITEDTHTHTNGTVRAPRTSTSETITRERAASNSMPVRERKAVAAKRAMKGDGSTILASNNTYNVKLLPSTPRELRKPGTKFRGSLLNASSAAHVHGNHSQLALAVTRTQAWVWEYTAHATVGQARVFDVPFADDEVLPFGALVASVAGTDIGLVLLSANTGRVVFYESIERSAASLGLFPERKTGVEGLVALFSGEAIADIEAADHAGFILRLSSGRIAQLTLRDAQGKARVQSQFLRVTDASSSGLFGSIKGLLGAGAWKKDLVAVHTQPHGTRGKMQVISLTERAEVQAWDLDWNGRYDFNGTIDFHELLVNELKTLDTVETQGQAESFVALDFAIADAPVRSRGNELAKTENNPPLDLWVLVRVTQAYIIVKIKWTGETPECTRLQRLDTYQHATDPKQQNEKPRLFIPKPGHTGFVAFSDAVVMFTTTDIEIEGPEAQLHTSTYADLNPFEDTVYLRTSANFGVLDAVSEDQRLGHASCIAFVQGAGLVRISATDPVGDVERTRISIKSKIEQAVFYGLVPDNCLDFKRRGDNPFSAREIEDAALEISEEILRSDTSFISNTPTSIDTNLAHRAKALRALITHVRQNYPVISRTAMWRLLWDAEKIAAGQEMWRTFEEHKATSAKRSATLMDEICISASQKYNWTALAGSAGEELVMKMFVFGLQRLEELLPMIRTVLEALSADQTLPSDKLIRLVWEADDLYIRTLEAAFSFRVEHAAAYGIAAEFLDDGVLTDSSEYAELPEFWTSTEIMLKAISKLSTMSRISATESFQGTKDRTIVDLVARISIENPRLVQLCCLSYRERIPWLASRVSDQDRAMAVRLEKNYEQARYDQIRALQSIGQSEAALRLAEKYKDMHTLTELIVGESQYYIEIAASSNDPREKEGCKQILDGILDRTGRYFDKFGDAWANAFFDEAFSSSRAGLMLDEAQKNWGHALTKYLRAQPGRARLSWINDVLAEQDYRRAAESLALAGKEQETMLWAKKVELSMSKLALMAAQEVSEDAEVMASDASRILPTRELSLVEIQEQLYAQIRPRIRGGIDRQAQTEIAITSFCSIRQAQAHALHQLLVAALDRVLDHQALSVEELVDVLSLMDKIPLTDDPDMENLEGAEFILALRALSAAETSLSQPRFETLLQLIWKRCYLSDDWITINKQQRAKGSTEESILEALRSTSAWRTIELFQNSYLSNPDSTSGVRIVAPSACLGAGCSVNDLQYRFPSNDDLLQPILHDNKVQDEILQSYVQDRRLDAWIERCEADVNTLRKISVAAANEKKAREDAEDEDTLMGLPAHGGISKTSKSIKVEQMFDGVESDEEDVVDGADADEMDM